MSRKKLLIAAATVAALIAIASFSVGQTRRSEPSIRQAVRGANSAVAAGSDYATDAGMKMMTTGGNAMPLCARTNIVRRMRAAASPSHAPSGTPISALANTATPDTASEVLRIGHRSLLRSCTARNRIPRSRRQRFR